MDYKNCNVTIKNINFKAELIGTENNTEIFNITITNLNNNKSINQKFKNSIMEYNLSKEINHYVANPINYHCNFIYFLNNSNALKGWAGYDNLKNLKELDNKRIEYLLYSVIYDFSLYINFVDCINFGYEEDSIKAKKVYEGCLNYSHLIRYKLFLDKDQEAYFLNIVKPEDDVNPFFKELQFNKDLKDILLKQEDDKTKKQIQIYFY